MFTFDDGKLILNEDHTITLWVFPDSPDLHLTVPKGFKTDGASIPRPLWFFIGPPISSDYIVPALCHDYLCERAKTKAERTLGDAVFFKLLRDQRVKKWKIIIMYFGVGFFGRYLWKPPEE
jgi:hypothetical protein